jgi:hypothetical protein
LIKVTIVYEVWNRGTKSLSSLYGYDAILDM